MAGERGKYYPILIDGQYFDSVRQASKELRICTKYIHKRCKDVDWPNYEYTEWKIPQNKVCNICGKIKPLSEFHDRKRSRDGKHTECKNCSNSRNSKWRKENLDKRKNTSLKHWYNITLDEYKRLFENQEGKCLICGTHQDDLDKALAVDHDHNTEKVRGLLCSSCNLGLGNFKENISALENAIKYLKKK